MRPKTEDLITKLSGDLEPGGVKALESFGKRFAKWILAALLCTVASISILGLNENWGMIFSDPFLLLQNGLILLTVLSAAAAALLLSVPGNERKRMTSAIVFLPFGLLLVSLVMRMQSGDQAHINLHLDCVRDLSLVSLWPASFLFILVRQGAPLQRGYVGLLALLASAGLGAWVLDLTCSAHGASHVFFSHLLPVLGIGLQGIALARLLLKRI